MGDDKVWCLIFPANRKGRTGHFVGTAAATHQPPRKGSFATTQIADEFNNFAAAQLTSQPLGELLGALGTGRFGLPSHDGIHTPHILSQAERLSQALPDAPGPS